MEAYLSNRVEQIASLRRSANRVPAATSHASQKRFVPVRMAQIEREISPSPRGGARARPCNAEQSFAASLRSLPDWKSLILSVSHNLHMKRSGFPFSRNLDSNLFWPRSFQKCLFLGGEETEAVIHFQCHIPFLIRVSNGSNHTSRNIGFFHFKLFMCFRMSLVSNFTQKIWLFLFFLPFVITTRT